MKLAFVTFSTVPFGSNDLLYYKSAMLALEQGHSVLVSPWDRGAGNAPEYERISRRGATVHYRASHGRHPNFIVRQWQKLSWKFHDPVGDFTFLKDWTPDVIVLSDAGTYHMVSAPGLADFLLSQTVPFVTISQFNDENSVLPPGTFQKARRFFREATACVFVSQRNLDVARRQLCLNLPQALVLDNPPNLTSFETEPFPDSTVVRMAMVGRLECAVKGQALVLEILSQPVWRRREWILNIYGSGPDEEYLRELIAFYGLQDRVQLCGYSNDVREVWKENAILLMCSAGEGKPLALTEALLCGRPAIVTDVGGNAELVEDGISGFVAESATASSFSSAMERAWNAMAMWRSMGTQGHARMIGRLTPSPEEKLLSLIIEAGGGRAIGSDCSLHPEPKIKTQGSAP